MSGLVVLTGFELVPLVWGIVTLKGQEKQKAEVERERRRLDDERRIEEEVNREVAREVARKRMELERKASKMDDIFSAADKMVEREKRREREREREKASAGRQKDDVAVRERLIGANDMNRTADFDDILEKVRRQNAGAEEKNASLEAFARKLAQEKLERHSLVDAYLADIRKEEAKAKEEAKEKTKPAEVEEFEKLLFSMEEEYAEIVNDGDFFRFHKESVIRMEEICKRQHTYRSYQMLREIYFGEFKKLKKAREKWHKMREKWSGPFDEAYIRYRAGCNLLGRMPEHFYLNPETAEEDVRLLNQKAKEMEDESLRMQAGMEAARILNEVMEEMGYQVLGTKDVTKKSGGKVHNTVFSYGEGSGIHVMDNGERITMELVGIDDEDRDASREEREYLEKEQVHFCEDVKEIERRLAKKGVIPEQVVSLRPPSQEHASIMDMDSYTVTEHKSKTKSLSKANKKAKRKQQGKKYMSNGERY